MATKKLRNRDQITFRLPTPLRKFIDTRAEQERRSVGEYLRIVIENHQRDYCTTSNQNTVN